MIVETIINRVCDAYGISEDELKGKSQSQDYTYPRHLAVLLSKELTTLTYRKLGEIFNKHIGSIANSVVTANALLFVDREFKYKYQLIKHEINSLTEAI